MDAESESSEMSHAIAIDTVLRTVTLKAKCVQ